MAGCRMTSRDRTLLADCLDLKKKNSLISSLSPLAFFPLLPRSPPSIPISLFISFSLSLFLSFPPPLSLSLLSTPQNPFGAAKPREAVLAQRTGVKEEDILKADVQKEKLHLRLDKEQRLAKEEAQAAVDEAKAELKEAEKKKEVGGDAEGPPRRSRREGASRGGATEAEAPKPKPAFGRGRRGRRRRRGEEARGACRAVPGGRYREGQGRGLGAALGEEAPRRRAGGRRRRRRRRQLRRAETRAGGTTAEQQPQQQPGKELRQQPRAQQQPEVGATAAEAAAKGRAPRRRRGRRAAEAALNTPTSAAAAGATTATLASTTAVGRTASRGKREEKEREVCTRESKRGACCSALEREREM